jgi:hypothetical protein
MPDFLGRLVDRALGTGAAAQPLIVSQFAPSRERPSDGEARFAATGESARGPDEIVGSERAAPAETVPAAIDTPRRRSGAERAAPSENPLVPGEPRGHNEPASLAQAPHRPSPSAPAATPPDPARDDDPGATMAWDRATALRFVEPSPQPHAPSQDTQAPDTIPRPGGPAALEPWPSFGPRPSLQAPAPASRHMRSPRDEPHPPVIKVTIGRVDVRAEFPAPSPARAPARRTPTLSLQDYARERSEGKR